MKAQWLKLGVAAACALGGVTYHSGASAQQQAGRQGGESAGQQADRLPAHPPAPGDGKHLVVQLCDGETNLEVPGVKPDERLTPEQAAEVSGRLMAMWMEKQSPEVAAAWRREAARAQQKPATADPGSPPQGKGAKRRLPQETNRGPVTTANEQVADFSPRDYRTWKKELEREVAEGDKIFHDDKLLGSTNGVSCAMCHPNAANTHPETYPKFQIQLRRVALLRDMINWCIENPSRGQKLDADDPKMRALEAYIMSQRRGTAMEPGKH